MHIAIFMVFGKHNFLEQEKKEMKYICQICEYVYDDDKEEVPFEELPEDWECPLCGATKSEFEPVEE